MARKRVLITGSADGLGLMTAQLLAQDGHAVVLHARNAQRAAAARAALPTAEAVVVGDVSTLAAIRSVAEQAAAVGAYDAVIHNVAVGYRESERVVNADGIERLFCINVVAPYMLTALLPAPQSSVYLTSGMQRSGQADLTDPEWQRRPWNPSSAYANSKLYDTVLAFAVARRWSKVRSNSVEPGWVATKMGGAGAPDDLHLGNVTQAWLAVSDDAAAQVSGRNFFHQKEREAPRAARDPAFGDELLAYCQRVSGVALP